MAKKNEDSVPQSMKEVYENVIRLTDDFCHTRLDEEYAQLCQGDGIIIDARSAPPEVREEAYRLGLIPYIPGAQRQES